MSLFKTAYSKRSVMEPEKPVPVNIFTQALNSINSEQIPVGNFTSVTKDQSFDELFELAGIAKEKGMHGQAMHIGRRIVATALEKQGMSLLATRDWKGRYDITRIHKDGNKEFITPPINGLNHWKRQDLSRYSMHMPDDILKSIPANIVNEAKVFVPYMQDDFFVSKDPIIAVLIHTMREEDGYKEGYAYYSGIYMWD